MIENEDSSTEIQFADACSDVSWEKETDCTPSAASSLRNKNQTVERCYKQAQNHFQDLEYENTKLKLQLANEQAKAEEYELKLRENQSVFKQIQESYSNLNCQTKLSVDNRDSERACSTFLASNHSLYEGEIGNKILVKKESISGFQQSLKTLKYMIERREQSWSINVERERKYKQEMVALRHENCILREIIKAKNIERDALKMTDIAVESTRKETMLYKKIIVKLEKRLRDLERVYCLEKPSPLNEREQYFVQQLFTKYFDKKMSRKLARSVSLDREKKTDSKIFAAICFKDITTSEPDNDKAIADTVTRKRSEYIDKYEEARGDGENLKVESSVESTYLS